MNTSRGEALRSARKALRLTQQQVADKVGVTRAAVGLWENDEPISFPNLKAVCAALGIDVAAAADGAVKQASNAAQHVIDNLDTVAQNIASSIASEPNLFDKEYFIKRDRIPLYTMSDKNAFHELGNALLGEAPIMLAPRFGQDTDDNAMYRVWQDNNVMEPLFPAKSDFRVTPKHPASIGDYVIVNLNDDKKYPVGQRPTGVHLLPVYFGRLEDYSSSAIILSQTNPQAQHAIQLKHIASIHRAFPPTEK
ncbi:helix-turn-helix transcriptional regulator [Methylobacterium sp. W2]|uniref:helix-turn-helix transcriptional regulator n=1 Tax=Methylobacterium sp. W2 TaxID=2598107 RepID=UPI001D0C7D01|nr:helix-turn-helix transcriptional regulator [Methylobacterium sp. W2]MCC0809072.1 helix-turn-helix transcriptional regulator [Methylobacterium sp. W2]